MIPDENPEKTDVNTIKLIKSSEISTKIPYRVPLKAGQSDPMTKTEKNNYGFLPVQRSIGFTGPVIGPFFVHAKGRPGTGPEDLFPGDIVHAYRDPEHGGQGHQF